MNRNRLSTNVVEGVKGINIQERVLNLLSGPSNYEIFRDGKILVKSSGVYLKGRGNIGIKALNENNELIYYFNSIKECALFFKVSDRTINRKLDKGFRGLVDGEGSFILVLCGYYREIKKKIIALACIAGKFVFTIESLKELFNNLWLIT